jgi:hypothetical protein
MPMTPIELRLTLQRDLLLPELERLGRLSTVYGIRKVQTEGRDLLVEFDATRMSEAEVLSLVRGAGLPAEASP